MTVDYKKDIYFDPRLGEIYAKTQEGQFREFTYESPEGIIRHQFILRPILLPELGTNAVNEAACFDISTPYGYGGPMIMELKEGCQEKLLQGFADRFADYCRQEHIISEFIRFHPIANNAKDFASIYDVSLFNQTVGIDLERFEDPVKSEFSKSARKSIRRCVREGLTYEVIEHPDTLQDFADIYYETLDRNKAEERYYFCRAYFDDFVKTMPENILTCKVYLGEKVIAMGFYFHSEDILHAHLSGTLTDYLHLSPAYLLRYALVTWGKAHGYKLIHTGGGRTGDPQDNLYRFKQKFGRNTEFEFYLGRKIWNQKRYDELVAMTGTRQSHYFPQFRRES